MADVRIAQICVDYARIMPPATGEVKPDRGDCSHFLSLDTTFIRPRSTLPGAPLTSVGLHCHP
jgi:hypothetical protein